VSDEQHKHDNLPVHINTNSKKSAYSNGKCNCSPLHDNISIVQVNPFLE